MRKVTGVQKQTDATNRNAAAMEADTKQASMANQAALSASAKASADQQSMLSARSAAEAKATAAVSAPLGSADVQLDEDSADSVSATRNKRKASFGRSYTSGVSI